MADEDVKGHGDALEGSASVDGAATGEPAGAGDATATTTAPAPAVVAESDEEKAARRAARAQRERERRAKRAAAREKAAAKAAPKSDDKPAKVTKAVASAEAEKERTLALALSGTVEGLASTVALAVAGIGAPGLGRDRSDKLGELWARVLAPYLDEDTAKYLPVLLAGGVTVATGSQFAAELVAYKREKDAEAAERARGDGAARAA